MKTSNQPKTVRYLGSTYKLAATPSVGDKVRRKSDKKKGEVVADHPDYKIRMKDGTLITYERDELAEFNADFEIL